MSMIFVSVCMVAQSQIKIHCRGSEDNGIYGPTTDDVITIEWEYGEYAIITSQTYGFKFKFLISEVEEKKYEDHVIFNFWRGDGCMVSYGRYNRDTPIFCVRVSDKKIYVFDVWYAEAYNLSTSTWGEPYPPLYDTIGNDKLLRKLKEAFASLDPNYEWTLGDELRIGEDENSAWY